MDGIRFDSYLRLWSEGSRRGALRLLSGGGAAALLSSLGLANADAKKKKKKKKKPAPRPVATFNLVRSVEAQNAGCITGAAGRGQIFQLEGAERLTLSVSGLSPNTEFEVFIIQAPDAPFGQTWYQGDLETDGQGAGSQTFIGRFNDTTHIVAPGSAPAPVLHTAQPFPDADTNPASNPIHTFHVGLWFQNAAAAQAAGCPNAVTPFAARHHGGIQALKTQDVNGLGPLAQVRQA